MLNTDKELKLYYSIGEVADMFGVNQSLLRFWEKEFPQISPKTTGRGIRQYRKEDVETIGLIYHAPTCKHFNSMTILLRGLPA